MAGEIAELGPGTHASGLRPGQPVVIYPALFCSNCDFCLAGEQSMCRSMRIFGEHTWGGLAQYAVVPAANAIPLPDSFPFTEAAAVPAAYTTAWRMVVTVGQVRPGETVLVMGAGGGVGVAAVQIAIHAGANVIACARGEHRLRYLADTLRVRHLVDTARQDVLAEVMAVTGGSGADLVVDPVGAPTWRTSINAMRPGGRMTICGATGGDVPEISIREIYQRHRRILGAPMGNLRDFRAILSLVLSGSINPVIYRVLPLEAIHEAHRLLESREHVGKVVIQLD